MITIRVVEGMIGKEKQIHHPQRVIDCNKHKYPETENAVTSTNRGNLGRGGDQDQVQTSAADLDATEKTV